MMENKIKKIKDVYITTQTLENNFPKSCIVECKMIDIVINDDDECMFKLRKKHGIKYEVFSTDERYFEQYLDRNIIKGEKNVNQPRE